MNDLKNNRLSYRGKREKRIYVYIYIFSIYFLKQAKLSCAYKNQITFP